MFLSNFTQLAGPSVSLKLWPWLKIEPIAENGAFFKHNESKPKPKILPSQNNFLTCILCKMKELSFQNK